MATAKKTTTKKAVTKKAPAKVSVKAPAKVAAKKPVAKTVKAKKATKKVAQLQQMRSFHVAQNQPPFTTFAITRQTVYWVILVAFIVFAQLWIISLQVEVAGLLDAQQTMMQDNAF